MPMILIGGSRTGETKDGLAAARSCVTTSCACVSSIRMYGDRTRFTTGSRGEETGKAGKRLPKDQRDHSLATGVGE